MLKHLLGAEISNLWNFHPENWGKIFTHFDDHIFERGLKTPTTVDLLISGMDCFWCVFRWVGKKIGAGRRPIF